MKESNIQTLLMPHLAEKGKKEGRFAWELKLCKGTSLPFNSVKEHQVKKLIAYTDGGFVMKFTDMPHFAGSKTRFDIQKPFDGSYLEGENAYVVVCFYIPRKQKHCYFINIFDWVLMQKAYTRKSITEEMAKEIAVDLIKL